MVDTVRVLRSGPRTTVQDRGRRGFQHIGFGVAGASDERCARLANHLVGNGPDAAVLESTIQGPRLRFTGPAQVSVVGCDPAITVNGVATDGNCTLTLAPGDVVDVPRTGGARAYIGIRGGVSVPLALNSRSTDVVAGFGGHHGRPIQHGDEFDIAPADPIRRRGIREPWRPLRRTSIEVRFVMGPEAELFTHREHEAFVTSSYVVHQDSNSLGLRLDGPEVASPPQILSEGQPAGSVQIPPGGQPIVLLPARQTLGGYAKIAVVVRPDLAMLAQALPGDVVTFTRMDFEDATALTRQWLGELTSATAVTYTLEAG